jgi:hypothetical protein
MSLSKKSWLFALWMLVVALAFPYWLPVLQELLGPFGLFVGAAFLLGQSVLALALFACPDCGLSVFRGGPGLFSSYGPIPRRRCGSCGRDHRAGG